MNTIGISIENVIVLLFGLNEQVFFSAQCNTQLLNDLDREKEQASDSTMDNK